LIGGFNARIYSSLSLYIFVFILFIANHLAIEQTDTASEPASERIGAKREKSKNCTRPIDQQPGETGKCAASNPGSIS
jgi:hypothetical protein